MSTFSETFGEFWGEGNGGTVHDLAASLVGVGQVTSNLRAERGLSAELVGTASMSAEITHEPRPLAKAYGRILRDPRNRRSVHKRVNVIQSIGPGRRTHARF